MSCLFKILALEYLHANCQAVPDLTVDTTPPPVCLGWRPRAMECRRAAGAPGTRRRAPRVAVGSTPQHIVLATKSHFDLENPTNSFWNESVNTNPSGSGRKKSGDRNQGEKHHRVCWHKSGPIHLFPINAPKCPALSRGIRAHASKFLRAPRATENSRFW